MSGDGVTSLLGLDAVLPRVGVPVLLCLHPRHQAQGQKRLGKKRGARSWLEVLGAFPRGHDVWLEDESIPSAARHDSQHWETQTGFSWCWGVSVGLQLPRNSWGITKTIIQGSACLTAR